MKQLTREQLAAYVTDSMIEVYKENKKELLEEIDNSRDNLGGLLGICIARTMQFCSMVLVDTLDHVLNNE